MERILTRLERSLGRFALPGSTNFLVGGMAIAFVLGLVRPELLDAMTLDLAAVRAGQVWRLVSYVFLPQGSSPLFILFQLSFTWFLGRSLEAEWGAFRLNLYYLLGMLGTTLAAWLTGEAVGNFYLTTTLFLAFATLFPDYQISLYLVIPVRVKWLGWLSAALLGYQMVVGSWASRAAILAATLNYGVFFGERLVGLVRARVRARGRGSAPTPKAGARPDRACSACGATEASGADIRVCSCARCGVPTLFCLEHARSHQSDA